MIRRLDCIALVVRALAAGAVAVSIVMISLVLARPEAAKAEAAEPGLTGPCAAAPEALAKFQSSGGGTPEAPVTFTRDGDRQASLADHSGRGVVLNFWATWCAPCVKEMPALDALRAELAEAGVDVLAVSSDLGGADTVRAFYGKNGIEHLPVLTDPRSQAAQSLGVLGLPTTVLFDPEGREVGRVVGAAEWDDPAVAAFLRACLAPPA